LLPRSTNLLKPDRERRLEVERVEDESGLAVGIAVK